MTTIKQASSEWLSSVRAARSRATAETYGVAYRAFESMLAGEKVRPGSPVKSLDEKHIGKFAAHLKGKSPNTEKLYLTAIKRFYDFCNAEDFAAFNMSKVSALIKNRSRKVPLRDPVFPKEEIERVLDRISKIPLSPTPAARLRDLRDIAFILTLPDTGLRVHEACNLIRSDLKDGAVTIIGKGDQQGKVFFKKRSKRAISQYLRARAELDGATGRPLESLPVFARHNRSVGKGIETITPVTGRNIVKARVAQVLGTLDSTITPHKFRHFFVTVILNETGDLKKAQLLARHKSISVTERYAHLTEHELEDAHKEALGE